MLSLDGWTVFFTIVNVLVLFIGLKVFLFKPVLNIIRQREEMIGQQFAEAAKKEQDAQQMKEEYQEKLKEAGRKAEEIVAGAKERAAEEERLAAARSQEEAARMIARAKEEIRVEQEQAKKEVQADVALLAIEAARKIIKTGEVHEAAGN
ncbi:MAG: F0F1 ATP synthase subunit B [Clostridiales bacterium]|uniref:ATP synthase subunit b n=1 Tax=Candidatus Anaerobutyricum stercoripullorum TaxID=2838456 RepID=A0A9D2BCY0_9FIRM|nr:F0F1 ATP synthase subunit B [Clostridiales bacterium]HIX71591.1 F0F1 ATP synthase subunit B [Candidatus Anaerobutyricum stercoripullorum]